jgi:short-subunit dehydrogenase
MSSFAGKVVVITGASEGIGRALALHLSPQKPKLVLAGRNAARVTDAAEACRKLGAQAVAVAGDLSVLANCKAVIEAAVREFGGVDVLVNNAGITMWADFEAVTDPGLIEHVMRVNYFSCAWCTHFALPYLKQSRGQIVGVSSIAGIIGVPGHSIYGASKHAVHGFLNSLRVELKPYGIGVTIVSPDFVITEIHYRGLTAAGTPMGKRLDPKKHLSAADCAAMMAKAIAERRRQLMTSPRGQLLSIVRDLLPNLIDRIVAKKTKATGLH